MFCLKPNPEFEARVFLTRLGEDAPVPVRLKFRHKTGRQVADWLERSKTTPWVDVVDEILVAWCDGEVCGEDGQPVPYSRNALLQLLDDFGAAGQEICEGYMDALKESRRKN